MLDYIKLLDRATQEKKLNDEMEKEIERAELSFLWNSIQGLLDFICLVNYERKYHIKHLGVYYPFINNNTLSETEFREHVKFNIFEKGEFKEVFMCEPKIIHITVQPHNQFFKLNIVGTNWINSDKGMMEVSKNYNSIDELVIDITNYLVNNAEMK
jgi:hypothetical protein